MTAQDIADRLLEWEGYYEPNPDPNLELHKYFEKPLSRRLAMGTELTDPESVECEGCGELLAAGEPCPNCHPSHPGHTHHTSEYVPNTLGPEAVDRTPSKEEIQQAIAASKPYQRRKAEQAAKRAQAVARMQAKTQERPPQPPRAVAKAQHGTATRRAATRRADLYGQMEASEIVTSLLA